MAKKRFALVLAALLLSIALPQGAGAQSALEEVVITVWNPVPDHFDVGPGEVAVVRAGWGACTPGLVRSFIVASEYQFTLYDELGGEVVGLTGDEIDDLWGEIAPLPGVQGACPGNQELDSASWRYVLPTLAPGTYTLHASLRLKHAVIDGGDYDGDGAPDKLYPENFEFDHVYTITAG